MTDYHVLVFKGVISNPTNISFAIFHGYPESVTHLFLLAAKSQNG
jgi:hypothetical protein